MTHHLFAAISALLLSQCSFISGSVPNTTKHHLQVGTLQRSYRLHVPPSLKTSTPSALVIVLHGSGDDGEGIEDMTKFSPLADKEGFIVAYPDALDENWNDGRQAASIPSQAHHVDDVAFMDALIDDVSRTHSINAKRIYATGFSNGGLFADYLGAHLSTRLAAIAPVSGGIAEPAFSNFHPKSPISVLTIHGDKDDLVPFNGGNVDGSGYGRLIPTEDAIRFWRKHDNCSEIPTTGELPDIDPKDNTRSYWKKWSGGKDGTEVELITVQGGGHGWPEGPQFLPPAIIGYVSQDFDATKAIWEFFEKHPKR